MANPFGESDISYVSCLTMKAKGVKCDNFLIIKGSIKNNGRKKVTQCVIKIIIYDQNNDVVCTDEAYVYGDIAPEEAHNFHSITAWPNSAKIYNLTIEEVRVKH